MLQFGAIAHNSTLLLLYVRGFGQCKTKRQLNAPGKAQIGKAEFMAESGQKRYSDLPRLKRGDFDRGLFSQQKGT